MVGRQAGSTDTMMTAMKVSLETARADKEDALDTAAEMKEVLTNEVDELNALAERHERMWAKVSGIRAHYDNDHSNV